MPHPHYQPLWIKGNVIRRGARECMARYETVAEVARTIPQPFTVLDIGANHGYFSNRLAADFQCSVIAVECNKGNLKRLIDVSEQNDTGRVFVSPRTLNARSLRDLSHYQTFDLILALSVIHHLGGEYEETIDAIESAGDRVVYELATERSACGQKIVRQTKARDYWTDLTLHQSLSGKTRAMYLWQRPDARPRDGLNQQTKDLMQCVYPAKT